MGKKVNLSKFSCFSLGSRKRGISAVVATVLIILITVAAVSIIWAAIIPMIEDNLALSSLTSEVSVVTSEGYTFYDAANELASVQVERGVDDDATERVNIIFSIDGNTVSSSVVAPELGNSKTYVFDMTGYGAPEEVSVAPIFVIGESEKEGSVTSEVDIRAGDVGRIGTIGAIYEAGEDYSYEIPVAGLVGWWGFEDSAEDLAGGNDGVVYGAEYIEGRDGRGKALYFDRPGEYVSLGASEELKPTGDFSLSFWVKLLVPCIPATDCGTGTNYHIYIWENYRTYGWTTRIDGSSSRMYFRASRADASSGFYGNTVLENDTLYHGALVYSEGIATWYLNGEADGNALITAPVASSTEPVTISTPGQSMIGMLDDVRLYNRALSEEEVLALYNS